MLSKNEKEFDLKRLGGGFYKIEIQAFKDGIGSDIQTISITIIPWEVLILLLLAGIIAFVVKKQRETFTLQEANLKQNQAYLSMQELRLKENEEKLLLEQELTAKELVLTENKREQDKLQVQAIVNQLNPHFINNALQWVQGDIEGNPEAQDVIQKLAENIGTVFINSKDKKCYHLLSAEFKLIKNYLFIQKYRFEERLTFHLPDDAILNKFGGFYVPLMLLQIHCENAIEHGINKQKKGGYLTLSMENQDENYIKIVIEDNGIGRRRSAEIGSHGTQQGTKMLKNLENIFNKQNELSLQSWYEDDIFVNEKGEKHGTRVHLIIPKKYNYEI